MRWNKNIIGISIITFSKFKYGDDSTAWNDSAQEAA